jgi:hypothetical protein
LRVTPVAAYRGRRGATGSTERRPCRDVNLMRVRDGKIVEALGYAKTGADEP